MYDLIVKKLWTAGGCEKWSPLRREPEAPKNNATSRNCFLATARSYRSRESAFHPRREPGDAKARDNRERTDYTEK